MSKPTALTDEQIADLEKRAAAGGYPYRIHRREVEALCAMARERNQMVKEREPKLAPALSHYGA